MKTLLLSAVTTLALLATGAAAAEDYPVRPVSLMVPYPAGGASDLLVPGIIAGGIGLGAIAIAASDSDNAVSK